MRGVNSQFFFGESPGSSTRAYCLPQSDPLHLRYKGLKLNKAPFPLWLWGLLSPALPLSYNQTSEFAKLIFISLHHQMVKHFTFVPCVKDNKHLVSNAIMEINRRLAYMLQFVAKMYLRLNSFTDMHHTRKSIERSVINLVLYIYSK